MKEREVQKAAASPISVSGQGLCDHLGYEFNSRNLLDLALTHTSWANEAKKPETHNERLEFLGDAVLELCVSAELYRRFPKAREGELTRMRSQLVNESSLARIAREIGIGEVLKLGHGEDRQGGRNRDSVLCDALEAVLGAIYQDGGFAPVQKTVARIFQTHWPSGCIGKQSQDNKSRLQRVSQQLFKDCPIYKLVGSSGPEHAKTFVVALTLPDGSIYQASNTSCKRAEQDAAAFALAAIESSMAPQGGSR